MAALVCDLCGGKLVMGSGGIAICDSCGMEHSADRMKEKVQEIKGTVRVDNSHMVDNWMKMGTSAAQAGNNKEAYEYFTKVIEVDPNNWRAIFEKGKAGAWQSTLGNSRTSELYQAVHMATEIIVNSDMPAEEVANLKNEFAVAIYNINNAFLDLRKENFEKHDDKYYDLHWDEWWEAHITQGSENIRQTEDVMTLLEGLDDDLSKSNVIEMKKHICEVLRYICDSTDTCWDSYSQNYLQCMGLSADIKKKYVEKHMELVAEIRENDPNYATDKYSQIDPFDTPHRWSYEWANSLHDKIHRHWQGKEREMKELREKELAKKRYTEYWQEHAEEKKQYEARIIEIDAEIKRINSQYYQYDAQISEIKKDLKKAVPAESQLFAIKKQQSELNEQKSRLGIFAGKQKKQLQEQIDALQPQIANIEDSIRHQRKSIQDDVTARVASVESERKPLKDQINKLEEEKRRINTELTKAR